MKKKINVGIAILMIAVFIISCAPMTVLAENEYVVEELSAQGEVVSDVNVRSGPSTDYEKIGTVRQGDALVITGKTHDDWYRIEFQGTEGFVYGQYIRVVSTAPAETEAVTEEYQENEGESVAEKVQTGFGILKAVAVIVIIAVIVVMIILILKNLRQAGDEDGDEEDEDDDYDDEDEEDDEDEDSEEDEVKVETAKIDPRTIIIREEDYQLHIDPKYFEDEPIAQPDCVTGYLQKKQQEEEAAKQKEKENKDNSGDLQKAMDKLQELQEEIEKLKNKQ
ncbi:MAG: SH3 domain-containing protein [Suilimivivens sp.]